MERSRTTFSSPHLRASSVSEGRQTRAKTKALGNTETRITKTKPRTRSTANKPATGTTRNNAESAKKTVRKTAITPARIKRPEQEGLTFEPDSKSLRSILNNTGVDGATPAPSVRQTIAGGSVSKSNNNSATGPRYSIYNNPNRHTFTKGSTIEAKRVTNTTKFTQPSPMKHGSTPNRQSLYNNNRQSLKPKTPLTAVRVPVKHAKKTQDIAPNTEPANKKWGEILKTSKNSKDKLAKVLFDDSDGVSPQSAAEPLTQQSFDVKCLKMMTQRESLIKAELQQIQKLEQHQHHDKENAGSPLRVKTMNAASSPRQPLSPANNRANILASHSPNPTSPLVKKNSPLGKENINDMVKFMKTDVSSVLTTLSSDSCLINANSMTTLARSIHDDISPLSPLARGRSKMHAGIAKSLFEDSDSVFQKPVDILQTVCSKCPRLENQMQMLQKELSNYKKQCSNLQSKVHALESKIGEKDSAIKTLESSVKQKECDLLHKERIMWQDREKFVLQMEKVDMQDHIIAEQKETIEKLRTKQVEKDKVIEEQKCRLSEQEKSLNEGLICVNELKEKLHVLETEISDDSGEELVLSGNNNTMVICEGGIIQNVKLQKNGCSPPTSARENRPVQRSPIIESVPDVRHSNHLESCCSPTSFTPIHNMPAYVTANHVNPCLYTPQQHCASNSCAPLPMSLTSSGQTPRMSSRPACRPVFHLEDLTPAKSRPLCDADKLPSTPSSQLLRDGIAQPVRPTPISGTESARKHTLYAKALVSHASLKYQDCLLDEEVMLYMVKRSPDNRESKQLATERSQMLLNPISKHFAYQESRQFQPIKDEKFTPSPPQPAFSAPSAFSMYKRIDVSVH
ncbi:uncharacterized protein LOC141905039 [Tubulanus polymorphus]|uniref:uncharacterized protein LOC141905039 n=1 Tax=Tubulanus polymorphus TaxID=672921 RepID=UPI003DA381A1